jgi:hypothetical protein
MIFSLLTECGLDKMVCVSIHAEKIEWMQGSNLFSVVAMFAAAHTLWMQPSFPMRFVISEPVKGKCRSSTLM